MKILHTVQFYPPSVGGMQEVVRQLSERMAARGHDVTVATTNLPERTAHNINGVKIVGFDIAGNAACGFSGEVDRYREFLLNREFDVITNFAAQQWATDIMLLSIDDIKAKKVFVPTGFSGLYWSEFRDYFESMKIWLNKYDMNIFLSENYRDINFARAHGTKNIRVIPNGAGADEFSERVAINIREHLGIPEDYFLILHVGSHTGAKGHSEALKIFARANIRNSCFVLVANSFGSGCERNCRLSQLLFSYSPARLFDNKKVLNVELSRKETVALYQAADLFLFPSNIECSPLVLFECMASQTPFLTTNVGNAAEIIEWSRAGLLLPTREKKNGYSFAEINSSAKMLEQIYYDKSARQVMQKNGYIAWQERFTWEKITLEYESLYFALLR